jgi:three-Cys-motif partner protein
MDREKLEPYAGREQASVKHFLLESYLERLIMITARKRYDRIAYVDAFAGPWKSAREDLTDTSFARAIEVMHGCKMTLAKQFGRSVSFRALFVEHDPERFVRLKRFADERSTAEVEIKAINEDFAESAESVARWIRGDELAFVLIDPTGWKDVISPTTLSPLLRKPNVEMLVNVMWNFINLATGHINQEQNLKNIFGEEFPALAAEGSVSEGANWMHAYLDRLRNAAGNAGSESRLRTAWFPVEFPSKNRVFYYLTYVTHHVKGMIVFLEESERTLHYQRQVKFVVTQKRREADTGMADIFGDTLHAKENLASSYESAARSLWLKILPAAGSEAYVDESRIADMAETCGCLIPLLQSALRLLIEEGVLENIDAGRPRPKNVVSYEKGETIRRLR